MNELRLEHHLECETCGGAVIGPHSDDNATAIALFGVTDDPYRVCPQCLEEIYDNALYIDHEFRRRVRLYYARHGIVLCEDTSGRWFKRRVGQ